MRSSKLYQTITQLSGHELNKLHRFILSPYFNQSDSIIKLFEWIKQDFNHPSNQDIAREDLWPICFEKDTPYNDGRMRKLISDLLKLIQDFFVLEELDRNPMHKANYLMEFVSNRNIEKLQSSVLKYANHIAESQILKPSSYYYYQYELERNIYQLEGYEIQRTEKANIEMIVSNLDYFYISEKLKFYCDVLSRLNIKSHDYNFLFIDEIINHLKSNNYDHVPAISIYYSILRTYLEPDQRVHYDKLKELISKHIHLFPEQEAKRIIDSALNYCIRQMNAGNEPFVNEAFELYKEALGNKLLFVKNQITPWSFKNIVTIGLRLYEFDWIENFIYTYSQYLDDKYRNNSITFNLAQLYFYKKEYLQVIRQLSQVEYEDMTYNLNSKTLLMASYYELDEIEPLNSLLDSFRVYLSRNNKIPAERRKHYLNTIGIVRKLARIRSGEVAAVEKLEKEVEAMQGVVSKNWIMEKLSDLKGQ